MTIGKRQTRSAGFCRLVGSVGLMAGRHALFIAFAIGLALFTPQRIHAADPMPGLSATQMKANGIVVARPVQATPAHRLTAYGRVLDTSLLVADAARVESSRAGAAAAQADLDRIEGLYRDEANASLKSLQSARAQQAEAQAQMRIAATSFAQQWGPVAQLTPAARQQLLQSLTAGHGLLLRADVPGRRSLGELPRTALVDLDGIQLPARVLGTIAGASHDLQTAALLVQIDAAPSGPAAGMRLPVTLFGDAHAGALVPRAALLYGENGAYVYRRLSATSADDVRRFEPVAVKLLQAENESWLVGGLDDDAEIVVQGAGVLWSLQGLAGLPPGAASDDDDD